MFTYALKCLHSAVNHYNHNLTCTRFALFGVFALQTKKKLARDCTTEATVALRGRNPPRVVGSKSKSHIVIKFGQPFSTAHHWFGPKTWVLKYFTMLLFPKLYVLIVRQRNLYYLMRRFYLILILLQDTMFKQTSWFPLFNYVSASCYHPSIIHQNLSSMLRPSYIKTLSPLLSQVGNKTLLAACLYPTMPTNKSRAKTVP